MPVQNPSTRTRLSVHPLEDRITPTSIWMPSSPIVPLVVTTAADTTDPNDGLLSLREAIQQANTNYPSSADIITFSSSLAGQTITLTQGELGISDALSIQGLGANQLTIDGNNQSRIFKITNGDFYHSLFDVSISGLKLTGGRDTNTDRDTGGGGAIFNQANLTISNCILLNNSAIRGGAINHRNGNSNLTIDSCTISNNAAQEGGGISAFTSLGLVKISRSTITHNSAEFGGGGIQVAGATRMEISECSIMNNTASSGGIDNSLAASCKIHRSTTKLLDPSDPPSWGIRPLIRLRS